MRGASMAFERVDVDRRRADATGGSAPSRASAATASGSTRVSRRSRTTSSPATMTSRTDPPPRPKIQCAASVAGVDRRRRPGSRGRRGRPARPGSSRPSSGSPKASPATRAPSARRSSGQASRRPEVVLAPAQVRRPTLLEHVGADAVGAQRDPVAERGQRRPADRRCSCSTARCGRPSHRSRGRSRPRPRSRWTPWARSDRRSSAPAAARRADDPRPGPRLGVALVGRVLGDVDVEADAPRRARARRRRRASRRTA